MSNTDTDIKELSLKELFDNNDSRYIVPIYQRNYDWGVEQIQQLIQDIFDSYCMSKNKYYIGSLVVWKRKDSYWEVVDGQQRLTTLSVLLAAIRAYFQDNTDNNEASLCLDEKKLIFESRKHATMTLNALSKPSEYIDDESKLPDTHNIAMYNAYKNIVPYVESLLRDNLSKDINIKDFWTYLLCNVSIFRVPLPADTDLNHYFEIMNNRGEQLEQHEIIKSYLLEKLSANQEQQNIFAYIWNACANMNRYVVEQLKDTGVFEHDILTVPSATELFAKLGENIGHDRMVSDHSISLASILDPQNHDNNTQNDDGKNNDAQNDNAVEKFEAIVNFPNFLLHVLRLHAKGTQPLDVPLDDKQLLQTFSQYLENLEKQNSETVLAFAYDLLRYRFLLDTYIIKRSLARDIFVLEKYHSANSSSNNTFGKDSEGDNSENSEEDNKYISLNRKATLLLSMFHVASSAQVRKNWLSAALNYLGSVYDSDSSSAIDPSAYVRYLEHLGYAFFKRSLADEPFDYEAIIYKNIDALDEQIGAITIPERKLHTGTSVPHFVFYYLDYLLWRERKQTPHFHFVTRNSIEHWFPQNPLEGISISKEYLHNFGNLCLITKGQNSTLSNNSPAFKAEHVKNHAEDRKSRLSRKQLEMANLTSKKKGIWHEAEINAHGQDMIRLLINPPQ